jgi:hypothetical protein
MYQGQAVKGAKDRSLLWIVSDYWTSLAGLTTRTWAGQSFETTDGVPQGKIVEETIQGSTITLQASEVVLVTIGG